MHISHIEERPVSLYDILHRELDRPERYSIAIVSSIMIQIQAMASQKVEYYRYAKCIRESDRC